MNSTNSLVSHKKPVLHRCCALFVFFLATGCVIASLNVAYANPYGWDSGTMNQVWRVLRTLTLAGGGIGISICAIRYMFGSEQDASKALSRGLMILGAVIAFNLLPLFIQLGKSVAGSGWKPPSN